MYKIVTICGSMKYKDIMLYVYHVVTEREMELNQVIEFNENTHSGVYNRVYALEDNSPFKNSKIISSSLDCLINFIKPHPNKS